MSERIEQIACALDALQCGAAVIDRTGQIVHINPRLAAMFGRDRGVMIGSPITDYYTEPEAHERIDRVLVDFEAPAEFEFYIPRADGAHLPIAAASRPLPGANGDAPQHRVITVLDISAQRHTLDELTRMSDTVLEQALELKRFNRTLTKLVDDRTAELHEANVGAITMLAVASEAKDESTGEHVLRIQNLAERLARAVGVNAEEAKRIGLSAILHDVGKMKVPDAILKKPGPLTDEERRVMQRHTIDGEAILSERPFFATARLIARSHHENYNGGGYPDGLAGEAIPLPARIVHLVDVYDALIHPRVYKDAWPPDQAAAEIRDQSGTMFDPKLVEAFDKLYAEGVLD